MRKLVGEIFYENRVMLIDVDLPRGGRIQVPVMASEFYNWLLKGHRTR